MDKGSYDVRYKGEMSLELANNFEIRVRYILLHNPLFRIRY